MHTELCKKLYQKWQKMWQQKWQKMWQQKWQKMWQQKWQKMWQQKWQKMWQQKWQKFGEKLVQTPVYLATTGNNSAKTLERTPAELCKTLKRIAFKSGFSFAGLGNVLGGVAVRPTSRCFGCTPYQIPGFVMHSLFGIPLWVSGRWHPWKYLVCPVASLGILGHPWEIQREILE